MPDHVLSGGFDNAPVQSAHVFRAVLSAMARPGHIEKISGAFAPAPISEAAAAVLLTVCDPETPLYLAPGHDGSEIRDWITFHTGAPLVGPGEAQFALGRWEALAPLDAYHIGTAEYPDRSATLIVEVDTLTQDGPRLTGPGIETEAHLSLPETAAFQLNRAAFPLGLDFCFTCGNQIAALPRTTRVEAF